MLRVQTTAIYCMALSAIVSSQSFAQPMLEYVIDPSLSFLHLVEGEVPGVAQPVTVGSRLECFQPIAAQTANGFENVLNGSIFAVSDGESFTFSGGTSVTSQEHPDAPFAPMAGQVGNPTPNPVDNYGGHLNPDAGNPSSLQLAIRNTALDILSGSFISGQAAPLEFSFTAGTIDFLILGDGGFLSLANETLPFLNESSTPATASNGTLTIPLEFDIFIDGQLPIVCPDGNPNNRIVAQGQIVAELAAPTVDGDFNDDGSYDCLDIDALVAAIATNSTDLGFDLTGDHIIDTADLDQWRVEAGSVNLGPGRRVFGGGCDT